MAKSAVLAPAALVTSEFELHGRCPSKKNSKLIARGRVITKPAYQAELQSLTLQARAAWAGKPPLTNCDMDLFFRASSYSQDLDNAVSGLMDCLVDAGVIADDNMNHVRCIFAQRMRVPRGNEGVRVRVTGARIRRRCSDGRERREGACSE